MGKSSTKNFKDQNVESGGGGGGGAKGVPMANSDSHYCAVRKKKKEEDPSVSVSSTQLEVEQRLPADPNASPSNGRSSVTIV